MQSARNSEGCTDSLNTSENRPRNKSEMSSAALLYAVST